MPAAGGQAGKHFCCISCSLGQLTPLLPGLPGLPCATKVAHGPCPSSLRGALGRIFRLGRGALLCSFLTRPAASVFPGYLAEVPTFSIVG